MKLMYVPDLRDLHRTARFLMALACGLTLGTGLRPVHAQAAPSTAPTSDALTLAADKVSSGDYPAAEVLLGRIVADQDRTTAPGATASSFLMTVYGLDGRYGEAQKEADALLAALPAGTLPDGYPDRKFVLGQQKIYTGGVQEDARLQGLLAAEHDPAAVLARQGQIAEHDLHPAEAAADYGQAFRLLASEPQAAQASRLLVEQCFFSHPASLPNPDYTARLKMIADWGFAVLEEPAALPERRRLALAQLDGVVIVPATSLALSASEQAQQTQDMTRLRTDMETLLKEPADPAPARQSLIALARVLHPAVRVRLTQLAAAPTVSAAAASLAKAVTAEAAGDWAGAADAYRAADKAALADPAHPTAVVTQIAAQAERSIPLMSARAALGTSPDPTCAFLGVDHTVGASWQGTFGTEGWVLFALHGDDLCGGPRLLDKSFSYGVRTGEATDLPRRWRNAANYRSRPGKDFPLVDPALPGESATAFVDDHGEAYPRGGGPDLYVDLSIPAGRHLLSLPLHFSDPSDAGARYALYLLAGSNAGTAASPVPHCLASTVVAVADAPGYVRAAVQGPAHYTLVVRHLDSLNANLPALFLDPDPRDVPLPKILDGPPLGALASAPLESGKVAPAFARALAAWTASAAASPAAGRAALLGRQRDALLVLAAQLRTQGRLALAEQSSDAAWEAQVRLTKIQKGNALASAKYAQNDLVQKLWADVARPYLTQRQEAWLWRGEDGPAPRRMDLALDAGYAGERAQAITRTLLSEDPVTALRIPEASADKPTPPGGPLAAPITGEAVPDPVALQLARIWVDQLLTGQATADRATAGDAGTAGRPETEQGQEIVQPSAMQEIVQPSALVVYALACQPLRPPTVFSETSLAGNQAPAATNASDTSSMPNASDTSSMPDTLLRADQMEALARALLNRNILPTDRQAHDRAQAILLLRDIRTNSPQYARLDQVSALLALLTPAKTQKAAQ